MGQKLVQAINDMTISASFKNTAYKKKFGFEHWGFDCYGSLTVWSQGEGIVLGCGLDQCYGKYVSILYFDVEEKGNVVANYFHLDSHSDGIVRGAHVNKDIRIGVMGKTGTYATGVHLHTEMRQYALGEEFLLSPYGTNTFKQSTSSKWFDPLEITFTKISPPDTQKYKTTNDIFINAKNHRPMQLS